MERISVISNSQEGVYYGQAGFGMIPWVYFEFRLGWRSRITDPTDQSASRKESVKGLLAIL